MTEIPDENWNNSVCHFEILTNNIDATRQWYEKNFGWNFTQYGPEMDNYAMFETPLGVTGGLRAPTENEKPGVLNYILVENVETALENAANTGATIVVPKQEVPNMGFMGVVMLNDVVQAFWQSTSKE